MGRRRLSRARITGDRRLLYVAATRAREELDLFARPACKTDKGGLVLAEPAGSLLATAWPALEGEVRARFEQWKAERATAQDGEDVVESIAASGQSNLAGHARPREACDSTPPARWISKRLSLDLGF